MKSFAENRLERNSRLVRDFEGDQPCSRETWLEFLNELYENDLESIWTRCSSDMDGDCVVCLNGCERRDFYGVCNDCKKRIKAACALWQILQKPRGGRTEHHCNKEWRENKKREELELISTTGGICPVCSEWKDVENRRLWVIVHGNVQCRSCYLKGM